MTQQSLSWVIYLREMKSYVHTKNLYTNIHCSFLCSSQKLEAAQISYTRWMDRQTGKPTLWNNYSVIKLTIDTHNNLDAYQRNYAEEKKLISKGYHIWYNSIYIIF